MIYIGNQTACWAATPNEPFDYAVSQGFDAFEWFPDKKPGAGWDETDLDGAARRLIRETAHARGMRLSVHARWQANPLQPAAYPLLGTDFELARELGAVLLNIHLFHEEGLEAFLEAVLPLVKRTAKAGLQLSIENTPHHTPEQFNEFFARLRDVRSLETNHVGMCLDIGHANLCAATRNDYLGFYDRLDRQVPIIHLHLHENWGDSDTHLPIFTGPAGRDDSGIRGLIERLRKRDYSGSIILEQWPDPPSLLDNARDRLLQLFNPARGQPAQAPQIGCPGTRPCRYHRDKEDPHGGLTDLPLTATPDPARIQLLKHQGLPMSAAEVRVEDFTHELVEGNTRWRSWREKLDFARSLLVRDTPALTTDNLVDIAVYLRFLGTGEIPCVEDGRHFRPVHHARIAAQIQERLTSLTTTENAFIVRKILPWLPSSAPAFQRPEPLTRIRDIAHRNDIDPDLKREIKTTLQNKLHRCAGPEDLTTSAAILERITAPGANHSTDFVAQFRIFHEELKEFFNARSLDDRLTALLPSVDVETADQIRLFQHLRSRTDPADIVAALESLTSLRENLLSSAREGSTREPHDLLLADIALEDHGFVLLSELVNACERLPAEAAWLIQTKALIQALQNLALSGVVPVEIRAVRSELQAWGELSQKPGREELLRVKATILRCRRLAEEFSSQILGLFSGRVEKLGRALGVAQHATRLFAESNIRGHMVFQVSKLAAALLRSIRERLGAPAWDILVPGKTVGRLSTVSSLEEIIYESGQPLVVLARNAAGDEEIPPNVAGIVLAQEMPHLSHLCVRARQAGVVFVSCEEPCELERLGKLDNQLVTLVATPEKVVWEKATTAVQPLAATRMPAPRLASSFPEYVTSCLPIEEAVPEHSGAKAAAARRLADLVRQSGTVFSTPVSMVIPFGVMEGALANHPEVSAEYIKLVKRIDEMSGEEIPIAARRLRALVEQIDVPEAVVSGVIAGFEKNARLVMRSSANCEDLEDFVGAGLYESVINVASTDVAGAIRTVWSSLWTTRAVLSRRQAGIPHEQARMAVLVQEMVAADFSFILHTANPVNQDLREVYAEIAVGLGETLASGAAQGSPYRLTCRKDSKAVNIQAFANFSQALRPGAEGGLCADTLDYTRIEFSRVPERLVPFCRKLAAAGEIVEAAFQAPQDVEGAVVGTRIFLVQARPQQGLARGTKS
jgi:phosphoglucan,water dikinase